MTNRALDLSRAGMTIRDIARIMKIGIATAHRLVDEGRKAVPAATRDALVKEIHERELGIILAHWPTRNDPDSAKVIQASDKLLVTMFGLEAVRQLDIKLDAKVDATAHDDVLGSLAALVAEAEVGNGDPKPDT